MRRKFDFSVGEYYHLYNRGTDKRIIFTQPYDYHRFLVLLFLCNSTDPVDMEKYFREGRSFTDIFSNNRNDQLVSIGAYCLMPNHFHLLVRETQKGGITTFMKKLSTGYSMYFNKKYDRLGALFQGRFQAQHADTDEYLKYLFAYIHLNPVKLIEPEWKETGISDHDRAKDYLRKYKYSSFIDYQGEGRVERYILDKDKFPDYFLEPKEFDMHVDDWLSYNYVEK